ncbi:MAG TPA: hypothetical protein VG053_03725 [Solirubrobacteraceae bacterium]|nr:hypothetical protein [Solirubrobacteraceae bacterium]
MLHHSLKDVSQSPAIVEEAFDRVGAERACEEESLGEVAFLALQLANLIVMLDSLGVCLQAESLAPSGPPLSRLDIC